MNKIRTFEKWTYRRILEVPLTAHTTNTHRLDRELLVDSARKTSNLGHILRGDDGFGCFCASVKRYCFRHVVLAGQVLSWSCHLSILDLLILRRRYVLTITQVLKIKTNRCINDISPHSCSKLHQISTHVRANPFIRYQNLINNEAIFL